MGRCPICRASAWDPLPNPQAHRAMIIDLRVIDEPLDKRICRTCGLISRRARRRPDRSRRS